jgi:hypothetical protein
MLQIGKDGQRLRAAICRNRNFARIMSVFGCAASPASDITQNLSAKLPQQRNECETAGLMARPCAK